MFGVVAKIFILGVAVEILGVAVYKSLGLLFLNLWGCCFFKYFGLLLKFFILGVAVEILGVAVFKSLLFL